MFLPMQRHLTGSVLVSVQRAQSAGLVLRVHVCLLKPRAMKPRTGVLKDCWIKVPHCPRISTNNIQCITLVCCFPAQEKKHIVRFYICF